MTFMTVGTTCMDEHVYHRQLSSPNLFGREKTNLLKEGLGPALQSIDPKPYPFVHPFYQIQPRKKKLYIFSKYLGLLM